MDLLGVRSVPFLARRNYFLEMQHLLGWSVLAGLIEGQFAAVVVSKTFHAGELMIAAATATPTAANLFSLSWGMLCVGRPKIRLAMIFAMGTVLCAGLAGAIPASSFGAAWFVAQVAASQILMAGVVTVRSAIWKSNYGHSVRGRITARMQGVRFVISVATSLIAARLGDFDPDSYRYIYPIAAVCGGGSLWWLSRIRIRGEAAELRGRAKQDSEDAPSTWRLDPFNLTTLLSPGHVFGQMYRVLKNDRRFRTYCIAQFLTGSSALITISVVVTVVTRDLVPDDQSGFWISTVLIDALPKVIMLGSIGRWGRAFDRLGVLGMRVLNVVCWTAACIFGMIATLITVDADSTGPIAFLVAVSLFVFRGAATGLAQGGGTIAWYIGHLHFAKSDEAEIYMGIHVSLTGVRGLLAPLGGMWLWRSLDWPGWVWILSLAFAIISFLMFNAMAREETRVNDSRNQAAS